MSGRRGDARVSTIEQDPALQHDTLTTAGCIKVFSSVVRALANEAA